MPLRRSKRPSQDLVEYLDDALIQDTPSIGGRGSIQNIRFYTHHLSRLFLIGFAVTYEFFTPHELPRERCRIVVL